MTTSSPHLHPLDGVDDLGEAVLSGLSRPIGWKQSPTVLRTLIGGLLTFGLLPVLSWQKKFRQYATLEQQQLWHLADWVRRSGRDAEGAELLRAAELVQPLGLIQLLILACLGFVVWTFYQGLHPVHGLALHTLLEVTYRQPFRHRWAMLTSGGGLYAVWVAGLSLAYLLHWFQVQLYATSVSRFLTSFNDVMARGRLEPVKRASVGTGVRPLWVVGAVICLPLGAPWAVFMMLAGSAQRKMIRYVSTVQRAQLATRLRVFMLTARPDADVPMPMHLRALCANQLCRAALSPTAQFCPRCGLRISTPLHRLA